MTTLNHFFDIPWDCVVSPWDTLEVAENLFLPSVQLQTQEEVDHLSVRDTSFHLRMMKILHSFTKKMVILS